MICRLRLMLILMVLYSSILEAQEETKDESPALDFIEFLGEWETEEGEWIDPNEFDTEEYAGLESEETEDRDDE